MTYHLKIYSKITKLPLLTKQIARRNTKDTLISFNFLFVWKQVFVNYSLCLLPNKLQQVMDMNTTLQKELLSFEPTDGTFTSAIMNTQGYDSNSTFANFSTNNLSTTETTISPESNLKYKYEIVKTVFHGILLVLIGIIGVVGNISGIIHFIKMERPVKFHWLMMTLFMFDTIFVLSAFIIFALPTLSSAYLHNAHMWVGPKVIPFLQMAMTGSLYCQIAFTIERYLVVCHPFYIVAKEWSVKRYIIPLVTFSIFYNLPKFFEIDTFICEQLLHFQHENITGPHNINDSVYAPTAMRLNHYYQQIYLTGMNVTFMLVGPFLVLIILNTLTLLNLKKYARTQRRDSAFYKYGIDESKLSKVKTNKNTKGSKTAKEVYLARISLSIVFISILIHSVKWVPTIYEIIDEKGYQESAYSYGWVAELEHVSHCLLVLDASIRFYIYSIPRSKAMHEVKRQLSNQHREISCLEKNSPIIKRDSSKPHQYSALAKNETYSTNIGNEDAVVTKPMLTNNNLL